MTDDKTVMQQTTSDGKAIPDVPHGKWKWQRGMAAGSFVCAALFPAFVILADKESADTMKELAVHWYLFHGGVVGAWFGGSTFAASKR